MDSRRLLAVLPVQSRAVSGVDADRAIPGTQMDNAAMLVCQDLDLHVPWRFNELFHVNISSLKADKASDLACGSCTMRSASLTTFLIPGRRLPMRLSA